MGQLSMLFDLCYYCNMAAATAAAAAIAILHARASR